MSNKNAKNAVNAPDVHVVAPSNMGKGLVWNDTTKQYEVSSGATVSPDAGNRLEARPNGLYLGSIPVRSNFYVSLQGNDANDGSRDAPVQSLHRAYELIAAQPTQGWYNIFLKAGQTFRESPKQIWLDQGKNLNFFHYDDPYFGDEIRHDGFFVDCYKELSRPTIVCDTYRDGSIVRWCGLQVGITNNLNFYGVNTEINTNNGPATGGPYRFYVSTMQHTGDITINGELGLASASIINLCNNVFTLRRGNVAPFINDNNPSLQAMNWVVPNQVQTLNGKSGTGRGGNVRQVLKYNNTVAGTTYDVATKSLFGFSANWDMFVTH